MNSPINKLRNLNKNKLTKRERENNICNNNLKRRQTQQIYKKKKKTQIINMLSYIFDNNNNYTIINRKINKTIEIKNKIKETKNNKMLIQNKTKYNAKITIRLYKLLIINMIKWNLDKNK